MAKPSKNPDQDHPLSFLKTAFGDAKKYPNISVSFGHGRDDLPNAYVKQARAGLPDIFHTVTCIEDILGVAAGIPEVSYRVNSTVAGKTEPLLKDPLESVDRNELVDQVGLMVEHCRVG